MKMQPFLLATLALPVAFSADVAPTPGHPGTEKVEVKLNRSVLDFLKQLPPAPFSHPRTKPSSACPSWPNCWPTKRT
jgi:hypothetical protein